MFISLNKTIGKVGGFRIGIGKRITSKNAWWMCLVICMVAMFQLMWYMMVLTFWLMYAMLYGMWWCCKKLFQVIANAISKNKTSSNIASSNATNYVQPQPIQANYNAQNVSTVSVCKHCGAELVNGNAFCIKCGNSID